MSIYFLRFDSLIKIGYSSHLASRVKSIVSGAPGAVTFLGHMPGERDVERHLHWAFQDERFSGEWFVASERLTAFVRLVAMPGMPADEFPTVAVDRAAQNEQWREMAVRVRHAAAYRWPTLDHKHRKIELTRLLEWGSRRVRALYESAPGMTLKQTEAEALERLLLAPANTMTNQKTGADATGYQR